MKKKKPKRQINLPDNVYRRFTAGFWITQPTGTKREKAGKIVRLLKGSYDTIELIKYLIGIYNGGDKRRRLAEVAEEANGRLLVITGKSTDEPEQE